MTDKDDSREAMVPLTGAWDPLVSASELGYRQYLHVGRLGMPVLELSSIIASFRQPTYDNARARLRMHVLLNWRHGYFKTSLGEMFMQRLLNVVDVADQVNYDNTVATWADCSFASDAKLRGSINNKNPVYPLIQRPTFIWVGELANLIGSSSENAMETANLLNQMLEEGRATVSLVKMTGVELEDDAKAELEARGIRWDPKEGVMSYTVSGTFWAASKPIESASVNNILEMSGFYDRINVVRWHDIDKEINDQWMFNPPIIPQEDFEPLKRWNERLWGIEWNTINAPPLPMVDRVKRELGRLYDVVEKNYRRSAASGLRSARDTTNIYHLLTAFSVIEQLKHDSDQRQDGILYSTEAMDRVLGFLPTYVRSRIPWS